MGITVRNQNVIMLFSSLYDTRGLQQNDKTHLTPTNTLLYSINTQ